MGNCTKLRPKSDFPVNRTCYFIQYVISATLNRILFSCAVYIKTQSDVFVTILEASNALPALQTPF